VALCPKKALSEGPLKEIAKGMDAPPVLIDLDACVFCGMCANLCPVRAFRMTVKERLPLAETKDENVTTAEGSAISLIDSGLEEKA
jgi:4Fe-4S ferredoxin